MFLFYFIVESYKKLVNITNVIVINHRNLKKNGAGAKSVAGSLSKHVDHLGWLTKEILQLI